MELSNLVESLNESVRYRVGQKLKAKLGNDDKLTRVEVIQVLPRRCKVAVLQGPLKGEEMFVYNGKFE